MSVAKLHSIVIATSLAMLWTTVSNGQDTKESTGRKGVKCCGMILRTEFGHPDRMAELSVPADTVLSNCIDSGNSKGLVDAFEAYLQEVDKEFGDSQHRDVVRSRLCQVFKSVESDNVRSKQLMAGFKQFAFASTLAAKGLNQRSIEEVRQSRTSFLRADGADSFCLMPVDLYLATALTENGGSTEAIAVAQSVVTRTKTLYGKRDEFVGQALVALGRAQLKAGQASTAEQYLREGIGILSEAPEIQPNAYLLNCSAFAETLLAQSKHAETAEFMGYLDPQIRKLFARDPLAPPVFNSVMMRAKALIALDRLDDAEKVLGRYPEMVQSLKDQGLDARNLLEVSATLYDKTDRAEQAARCRKWVNRIDAKLASAQKR